jgi:uncharacterized protein (TIGR02391 family)
MAAFPAFGDAQLQGMCDILGATTGGLTGTEIHQLLGRVGIAEVRGGSNKRGALLEALRARQAQDRCGNNVVAFVLAAMDPVRYTSDRQMFDTRRHDLNQVLAFCGYSLGENGTLQSIAAATTLSEAEERAGRLRGELRRRGVHGDVSAFCRAELLQANYFHAVFEATKSVADKIRVKTGLSGDGSELVDQAFGLGKAAMPFLAFNALQTDTERSEHMGLMNLMKGMFGGFRNVTAHAPKVSWVITEQDALDLLTIASLLHRRLDAAIRTPRSV